MKKAQRAFIVGFTTDDIPTKFYEMGLIPGAEIEFKQALPFHGPVSVLLCENKCKLAMLLEEAECIEVKLSK